MQRRSWKKQRRQLTLRRKGQGLLPGSPRLRKCCRQGPLQRSQNFLRGNWKKAKNQVVFIFLNTRHEIWLNTLIFTLQVYQVKRKAASPCWFYRKCCRQGPLQRSRDFLRGNWKKAKSQVLFIVLNTRHDIWLTYFTSQVYQVKRKDASPCWFYR